MKVWILTFDVDLGVSIEGVYDNSDTPDRLAAERNEKDRRSWVGDDGNTYTSKDSWSVQEHEVADGVRGYDELKEKSVVDHFTDTDRLDWLEREANEPGGILLHDGSERGRKGIGLRPGFVNRTLRQAIDSALQYEHGCAALKASGESEPIAGVRGCAKCGGAMKPGKAMGQTMDCSDEGTCSPAGPGVLVDCMKCERCGWSVTSGSEPQQQEGGK